MKNFIKNKGFTLIELILYVGIASFVLVGMVTFSWNIISSNERVEVSTELTQNGRLVLAKITQAVREAEAVDLGDSVFDVSPGVLALESGGEVVFETYVKNVTVGGEIVAVRKLRLVEGGGPGLDMTSDQISVESFEINNRTRDDEAENVEVTIGLEYVNPGGDVDRTGSLTLNTAISIRR